MQTAMNNKHVLFPDGCTREIFMAEEDLFNGRGMLVKCSNPDCYQMCWCSLLNELLKNEFTLVVIVH